MTLRVASPLSPDVELIVTRIIGSAITVHRCLGPGLGEGLYEDAMSIQLEADGLRFERQREVVIHYLDKPLRSQRIDLVVEDRVLVEIKAVEELLSLHRAQVISYLRSTGLRIGLLINFNTEVVSRNIRRIVV